MCLGAWELLESYVEGVSETESKKRGCGKLWGHAKDLGFVINHERVLSKGSLS